jgi:homoserine O-acetyltransferase
LVSALHAVEADVTYLDIESSWGHDAFLLEVDTMTSLLNSFLERLVREENIKPPDRTTGLSEDVAKEPLPARSPWV